MTLCFTSMRTSLQDVATTGAKDELVVSPTKGSASTKFAAGEQAQEKTVPGEDVVIVETGTENIADAEKTPEKRDEPQDPKPSGTGVADVPESGSNVGSPGEGSTTKPTPKKFEVTEAEIDAQLEVSNCTTYFTGYFSPVIDV